MRGLGHGVFKLEMLVEVEVEGEERARVGRAGGGVCLEHDSHHGVQVNPRRSVLHVVHLQRKSDFIPLLDRGELELSRKW